MALARLKRQMTKLAAGLETLTRQKQDALQPASTPQPFPAWTNDHLSTAFSIEPCAFHRWLAARLDALRVQRGSRLNVLAPRGSGKSAWISFAYPLWSALHGLEPYILLISDTAGQAIKYLEAIKQELLDNDSLRRSYPTLARKGPVWRNNAIRLGNGVVLEVLSTGSKIRGRKNRSRRPSLIVVDDPQNLEHVTSPVLRQRSWEWLTKDVSNATDPQTNLVVIGTALHRECIVCQLQKTPGWESHVYRAVEEWPVRMDLWREWTLLLHDWNDPNREAKARAYYETNKMEMEK